MIDKAKQAAETALLLAMNPRLVPAGSNPLVAAAKNMRAELAAAFPGVRFAVKSRRYAGGNAIDVYWEDGPVAEQVDEIVGKYAGGNFDGSQDLYTYSDSPWPKAFGSARYVFTNRRNSHAAIASALRTVGARWGRDLEEAGVALPSVADWDRGIVSMKPVVGSYDVGNLISLTLQRRTWALTGKLIARFVADSVNEQQVPA